METFGRYRVAGVVGRGAMGVVYRAQDPEIGRDVAIKVPVFPAGLAAERLEELRRRFLQESRAAGALSHPGIVAVHDAGRRADGTPYLVMEWLDGGSVADRMRAGPGAPAEVFRVGAAVARALGAAHRAGIVHRDVKPANLLFASDGTVKLVDFGVAHVSNSNLTRSGSLVGSPSYMAPEQIEGDALDGRADLYALCAVLFHWLTGRYPHEAADLRSLLYKIAHQDPPAPSSLRSGLPRGTDAVLLRGMARQPSGRPADGDALARDLDALAGDRYGAAAPAAPRRPRWKTPALVAAVLAGGLLLVAVPRAMHRRLALASPALATALGTPHAEVDVLVRHRLRDGRVEVRVNDRVAAERRLSAPRKPLEVFGRRLGTTADEEELRIPVAVAPGAQSIEVRVFEDDRETSAIIAGDLAEGARRDLVAEIRRFPRRIDLAWN